MDGEAGEFQDWELLNNSDETSSVNSSDSLDNMRGLEGIEGDSDGMIRTDHFSIDSQNNYVMAVAEVDASMEGSVGSDNPSWINPGPEAKHPTKESGESWPDSGSDRSDDREFGKFDDKHVLGFVEDGKSQVDFEGVGEIGAKGEDLGKVWADSGGIGPISLEFEEFEHDTDPNAYDRSELSAGEKSGEVSAAGGGLSSENQNAVIRAVDSGGEERKKSVVWWKLPFEFLKYCAFRVSPTLTLSVAAAVMGLVILGRRLHKMKRKSQSLQMKVTMDDKKVSQFMSRAARLNEAFQVVRRVPAIRPPLPAVGGVTAWPVMSLR